MKNKLLFLFLLCTFFLVQAQTNHDSIIENKNSSYSKVYVMKGTVVTFSDNTTLKNADITYLNDSSKNNNVKKQELKKTNKKEIRKKLQLSLKLSKHINNIQTKKFVASIYYLPFVPNNFINQFLTSKNCVISTSNFYQKYKADSNNRLSCIKIIWKKNKSNFSVYSFLYILKKNTVYDQYGIRPPPYC